LILLEGKKTILGKSVLWKQKSKEIAAGAKDLRATPLGASSGIAGDRFHPCAVGAGYYEFLSKLFISVQQ
jgi:hypothetical protein